MKKVWFIFGIGIFLLTISLIVGIPELEKAKVAKINIVDQINYGSYYTDPETVGKNIEKASGDPLTEAFVFTINSPGGSVVASKSIMEMINNIRKPTVCKINDIGTSGAYWIASGCDIIVADSLSMTGGIGATASYLEYSGLFEKYGINYERLVSGKYKDTGTPYRNLTERERGKLMDKLNKIHDVFVKSVSENRGLNYSFMKNISDGSVYLGSEAKELGLVDYLGGEEKVREVLHNKLDKEIRYENYGRDVSLLDLFTSVKNKDSLLKNFLSNKEERLPQLK
ncbi:MAG: signal peptide peptidase SppA [Candidatus Aenigmatarchaeota archaeon]